jgi:ABC-type transporter Mla maintaining outer membrane lipid asymmetry ATPase subunit MlaF
MAGRLTFLVDGRAISGPPAEVIASQDPRVVEFLAAEQEEPLARGAAESAAGGGGAP